MAGTKKKYLLTLQAGVKQVVGEDFPFAAEEGDLQAVGSAEFVGRKIGWWQRYRIERASGVLTHRFQMPGGQPTILRSEFILKDTSSNFLSMTLRDAVSGSTIIRPEFKQEVWLSPTTEYYHHDVIALTKLRFFPFPQIGDTIYFVRGDNREKLVPIGVASYADEP